jgi:membrane protein required for colicin V production
MDASFQALDLVVAAVIVVSTGYAVYRGFVNETLSIVSWLAAALATLYFGPTVAEKLGAAAPQKWVGEVCGFVGIFLLVLIPLSFMTFRLSQSVKKSQIGPLDRSLGGVFGIVRALFVLGLLYLFFGMIVPPRNQPTWIARSYSLPLVDGSAEVISSLVPNQSDESSPAAAPPKTTEQNTVIETQVEKKPEKVEEKTVTKPAEKSAASHRHKKIYGAHDRQALEKLIETTQDGKNGKP